MSPLDNLTDNDFRSILSKISQIGGKRWLAYIITTLIFILIIPKDHFTFATYVAFVMAWASLETKRRGGA